MSNKSNKVKSDQLGMPFGTANYKLEKSIQFYLIQKSGLDVCFRCGAKIENAEDLTKDHRIDWLHSDDPVRLFFSLENIAFSHARCNKRASDDKRVKGQSKFKGVSWDKKRKKWASHIWLNDKKQHKFLGYYGDEVEAARVYDMAVRQYRDGSTLNLDNAGVAKLADAQDSDSCG